MLSRTADNLYWLSRYVERAEYLARILEATHRLSALPLAYVGTSNEWESQVTAAVEKDQDLADTIRKLEEQYDNELISAES